MPPKKRAALNKIKKGSEYITLNTPVGCLTLIACDLGLNLILWDEPWITKKTLEQEYGLIRNNQNEHLSCAALQLSEYFSKKRKEFSVKIHCQGTLFQKKTWDVLKSIPFGQTISYQQQAITLGDKNKVRAVGSANGKNPISIIVPCHRVIAKNGDLTGFGGGLEVKKFLLNHEQSVLQE